MRSGEGGRPSGSGGQIWSRCEVKWRSAKTVNWAALTSPSFCGTMVLSQCRRMEIQTFIPFSKETVTLPFHNSTANYNPFKINESFVVLPSIHITGEARGSVYEIYVSNKKRSA